MITISTIAITTSHHLITATARMDKGEGEDG
jgi:hypothetical protein